MLSMMKNYISLDVRSFVIIKHTTVVDYNPLPPFTNTYDILTNRVFVITTCIDIYNTHIRDAYTFRSNRERFIRIKTFFFCCCYYILLVLLVCVLCVVLCFSRYCLVQHLHFSVPMLSGSFFACFSSAIWLSISHTNTYVKHTHEYWIPMQKRTRVDLRAIWFVPNWQSSIFFTQSFYAYVALFASQPNINRISLCVARVSLCSPVHWLSICVMLWLWHCGFDT